MMIGLVTGEEKCGCYVPTLRMLCTEEEEKAMVRSAPDGSDNHDSDDGSFIDNDDKNDQKTYK